MIKLFLKIGSKQNLMCNDKMPGERIFLLRKQLKLTRQEFWEFTGFNPFSLYKIEKGSTKVTLSKARMLSTFFVYRFKMDSLEASEEYILTGKIPSNKITATKFIPSL